MTSASPAACSSVRQAVVSGRDRGEQSLNDAAGTEPVVSAPAVKGFRCGREQGLVTDDRAIGGLGSPSRQRTRDAALGHERGDVGDPLLGNLRDDHVQRGIVG